MLFVLADAVSSGKSELPADATCTDLPCYWANPKGKSNFLYNVKQNIFANFLLRRMIIILLFKPLTSKR
jgi:hypothetical protein